VVALNPGSKDMGEGEGGASRSVPAEAQAARNARVEKERARQNRGFMGDLTMAPNGLELSCPAEAGRHPLIVAQAGGPGTAPYAPARRVSFSELLGSRLGYSPRRCIKSSRQ
jgi:hypothetical protein